MLSAGCSIHVLQCHSALRTDAHFPQIMDLKNKIQSLENFPPLMSPNTRQEKAANKNPGTLFRLCLMFGNNYYPANPGQNAKWNLFVYVEVGEILFCCNTVSLYIFIFFIGLPSQIVHFVHTSCAAWNHIITVQVANYHSILCYRMTSARTLTWFFLYAHYSCH